MEQRKPLGATPEVATYLGVPVQTLYVWRTKGVGPRAVRVGKHLRYRWSDVDAWLEQQADQPVGAA
ncbi:MAG: helix-turn-helix domain-containing protein [Actinomycetota bacterium]|nr:helix-turn-helix domain-containing protein [Actinomycetota bacterium]